MVKNSPIEQFVVNQVFVMLLHELFVVSFHEKFVVSFQNFFMSFEFEMLS